MRQVLLTIFMMLSSQIFGQSNQKKITNSVLEMNVLLESSISRFDKAFKDISSNMNPTLEQIPFFTQLDFKVLQPLSTVKHFDNVDKQLTSELESGLVLYIDSIKYKAIGNDSIFIKIYSQNEKWIGKSSYSIPINLKKKETKLNFKMDLDIDAKDETVDLPKYDSIDYVVSKTESINGQGFKTIKINKTYR